MPCDRYGGRVVVRLNQAAKNCGTRNVAALANVREQIVGTNTKRLKPRQTTANRYLWNRPRRNAVDSFLQRTYVVWSRTATSTHEINQSAIREFADNIGHFLRRLVVLAKFIGQACIRVRADARISDFR